MAQLSIKTVETGKVLCISLDKSDGNPLDFTQGLAECLNLKVGQPTEGGHRYLLLPTESFQPVGIVQTESIPPTVTVSLPHVT